MVFIAAVLLLLYLGDRQAGKPVPTWMAGLWIVGAAVMALGLALTIAEGRVGDALGTGACLIVLLGMIVGAFNRRGKNQKTPSL